MALPGFTAETSLYKTNGHYSTIRAHSQVNATVHLASVDMDCYNTCYGSGEDASYCRNLCCVEEVTCSPDPAYAGVAGCEICYKDFCEGPGVQWYTCPDPPPEPRLCYLNGSSVDCGLATWCLETGACEAIQ
jgi:hypothetical protein